MVLLCSVMVVGTTCPTHLTARTHSSHSMKDLDNCLMSCIECVRSRGKTINVLCMWLSPPGSENPIESIPVSQSLFICGYVTVECIWCTFLHILQDVSTGLPCRNFRDVLFHSVSLLLWETQQFLAAKKKALSSMWGPSTASCVYMIRLYCNKWFSV